MNLSPIWMQCLAQYIANPCRQYCANPRRKFAARSCGNLPVDCIVQISQRAGAVGATFARKLALYCRHAAIWVVLYAVTALHIYYAIGRSIGKPCFQHRSKLRARFASVCLGKPCRS